MDSLEKTIRAKAILRVAELFRIPVGALNSESQFGVDLQASFVSDFRRNELDQIDDDIHDVADRTFTKEFEKGELVIRTLGEYCDHMVRSSATNPKAVKKLFAIE